MQKTYGFEMEWLPLEKERNMRLKIELELNNLNRQLEIISFVDIIFVPKGTN